MANPETIEAKTLGSDQQHADNPTILDMITPGISERNLEPAITHFYSFAVNALRLRESVFLVAGSAGELPSDERLVSILPAGKFPIEWRQDDMHPESQACVVLPPDDRHTEKRFLPISSAIHQLRMKQLRIFLLTCPKEKTHQAIIHPKQPLSPEATEPYIPIRHQPKRKFAPLITPNGVDIRNVSPDRMAKLTDRQREVFTLALQTVTISDIARQLSVKPGTIRSTIKSGFQRIDHPRIEKEQKTRASRIRAQYLFHEVSILTMDENQRKSVYSQAHLTDRETAAMEAYIAALPLGGNVYQRIAQAVNVPTKWAVSATLRKIREKLADPDGFAPKPPNILNLVTPGGIDLRALTAEERQKHWKALSSRQQEIIDLALNGKSLHEITLATQTSDDNIWSVIKDGKKNIDHPRSRKERLAREPYRAPYLFNGESVLSKAELERAVIYEKAHLKPRDILIMEAYIEELPHGPGVHDRVAERTHVLNRVDVRASLAKIRKKLADPEAFMPKRLRVITLVTPSGIDLKQLPAETVEHHLQYLTPRQREVLTLSLQNMTLPDIATHLQVNHMSIRSNILAALRSIDRPKKEKQPAKPFGYKPYLWNGNSILTMGKDERLDIYAKAHLSAQEITTMEAFIVTLPLGKGVYKRVTQVVNAANTTTVSNALVRIRYKLAHPEAKAPKSSSFALLITPNGIDLRTVSTSDKERHWKSLTKRQQEVFTFALQNMTIPDIARQLNVKPGSIRNVVESGLHRVDHPEKQSAKSYKYKQYLWRGVSILTMSETERSDIYSKVHLSEKEVATMEAYIATLSLGKDVNKRVAENIRAASTATVDSTLARIRRKLEDPEAHTPKYLRTPSMVTPSGINLQTISLIEREKYLMMLTKRQLELFHFALQGMSIQEIVNTTKTSRSNVQAIILCGLRRIDNPIGRNDRKPEASLRTPILHEGHPISTFNQQERMNIYARAHLTRHEQDIAELLVTASLQQINPYDYITRERTSLNRTAVSAKLTVIRKKLADPEAYTPKPPKEFPLVTPNGINLRTLSPEEREKHWQALTPREREIIGHMLKGMSVSEIAITTNTTNDNIRSIIRYGLKSIDTPNIHKGIYARNIHRAPYLFKGESILEKNATVRHTIYTQAFLTPRQIETMEAYIATVPLGEGVYDRVAHIIHAHNIGAVNMTLIKIRKKLADPEAFAPKLPKEFPLVTPGGIDLQHAKPEELEHHMNALTLKQKPVIMLMLSGLTIPEIARQLEKQQATIHSLIHTGLKRIDNPRIKKEKKPSNISRGEILTEGINILTIRNKERMKIYAKAHLSASQTEIAELFVNAKNLHINPHQYIQKKLNAPSYAAVSAQLSIIRMKLENPNQIVPKTRKHRTHISDEALPTPSISAQACVRIAITEETIHKPVNSQTVRAWDRQHALPHEAYHREKPNAARWNYYVSFIRQLIPLCREQYPEALPRIQEHIRDGEPLPSFKTIAEDIEQQLPELILQTYINRFPNRPMTKNSMDQALRRNELTSQHTIQRIIHLLATLGALEETAKLYGEHSPFTAYIMQPDAQNAHLSVLTNTIFTAAASPSFGKPCIESIHARVQLSRSDSPLANFLKPILLQDDQQNALEQILHVKFDWATIYLDITPLALGQPETKRQRELAELINTKISQ